ncbi:MAG: long-chain fatty acid--CoA ligase [Deltaproteobacteria bacterium]|nr:long-chain fatty acid--CoA ligase [Deltaproteobacteria bacterium]
MAKNFRSWPKDWPKSINYPKTPVFRILDQTAERVPDRLALIFGGMELTFSQLKDLADRFAAGLSGMGVGKGSRVAIHLPNCPQFAIAYYGALKTGATFTPLSPLLSPREIIHQLNDSGAETLISLDLIYPGIASVIPETPVKNIITTSIADCYSAVIQPLKPLGKFPVPDTVEFVSILAQNQPKAPDVEIDPDKDLAHLAYTGGTTGVSKGVMLTHSNVVVNAMQFGLWFNGAQIEEKDGGWDLVYPEGVDPKKDRLTARDQEVSLVVVPWFHAMGTIGYLNNMVASGNTMIVFPRFDPVEYATAIGKYGATTLGGAPQLYVPLCELPDFAKYDLSGIKIAASGAAPLPHAVLDRLLSAFSGVVIEAYGLTECTMGACANPPSRDGIRPGSVGLPVFDTEVRVVDPVSGTELAPGQEGELIIKGPQVMRGYWNRPDATAEVLKDGWLYTGDIGRVDEDGYFYITDRKKDLILYKGYNVYPREIEEVLYTHPAVELCAVVGKLDDKAGELPVAFIQLRGGQEATEAEIMDFVNTRVAAYKKLREVFFGPVPVSAAGKTLKRELREKLAQQ